MLRILLGRIASQTVVAPHRLSHLYLRILLVLHTFLLLQDENMSGGESSDSSDGDAHEDETDGVYAPPASKSGTPPPSMSSQPATTSSTTTTAPSTTATTTSKSLATSQPPILSPLVYHTPQGMMYATQSNSGVIFSLAQTDPNVTHPQFITIPLSMVTANGQGELDLSKRK